MADNDYKTIEQRAWDSFPGPFLQGFYGLVATPFRVPTANRRAAEDQTIIERVPLGSPFSSLIIGGIVGMGGLTVGIMKIADEAKNNNYAPAIITASVLAATNLFSGAYEAVRSAKKYNLEQAVKIKGSEE